MLALYVTRNSISLVERGTPFLHVLKIFSFKISLMITHDRQIIKNKILYIVNGFLLLHFLKGCA